MRLTAQNFQSWDDFDLTIDGFTVIVGLSNLGKSALFRSLKGVIRNEIKANHIKIGRAAVSVKLQIDGHEVIATRKPKGSATYRVDGQDYSKLGGATPEVLKTLNLEPVMIGDIKLDPIFAGQFGGQFMLDETPSVINAILGAFSTTEKLEAGKKVGNSRVAECNSQAKALALEVQEITNLSDKLLPLKDQATTSIEILKKLENEFNTVELCVVTLSDLTESQTQLGIVQKVYQSTKVTDTDLLEKQVQLVRGLQSNIYSQAKLRDMQAVERQLHLLTVTPIQTTLQAIHNIKSLTNSIVSIDKATVFTDIVEDLGTTWNTLATTYKEYKSINALIGLSGVTNLDVATNLMNKHQETLDTILSEAAKSFKIGKAVWTLKSTLKEQVVKENELKDCNHSITDLESKIFKLNKEVNNFANCPNCGVTLSPQ